MGIHCEINLHKPEDGVFRAGSFVTGAVKYAVDEETQFKAITVSRGSRRKLYVYIFNKLLSLLQFITVSLKGKGVLHVRKPQTSQYDNEINYHRTEEYVHADDVIKSDDKDLTLPIGLYERQFSFGLPQNIPSSLKYFQSIEVYQVSCKISYYIRIKFERPGFLKRTKRYKKVIDVVSGIIPRLPTVPRVLGERKILSQLLSKNKTVVIKAIMENSVISPLQGGKINFNYEILNDSNVTIKNVSVKLFEFYTFYINNKFKLGRATAVKDTDSKTGAIKKRENQNMDMEIAIPSQVLGDLDFSNIVSRDYKVGIKVKLPMPHRNMVLHIPVQVGNLNETNYHVNHELESPPSYWEAMAEDDDDDDENAKSSK